MEITGSRFLTVNYDLTLVEEEVSVKNFELVIGKLTAPLTGSCILFCLCDVKCVPCTTNAIFLVFLLFSSISR